MIDPGPATDGCTGFWWAELIWPIHKCCVDHDLGGSDGTLLDCVTGAGVPIMMALMAILMMAVLRPAYEAWLTFKQWVKRRLGR